MQHPILEWSIRALLMATGTALVISALHLRRASARHRAWAAAMIAMLLLPVWTNWGPSVTAPVLPSVIDGQVAAAIFAPLATSPGPAVPHAESFPAAAAEPFQSAPRTPNIGWQQILLAIYLTGVAAMLVRLIAGTVRIASVLRHTSQADGVVTTPLCAAPVTIGWLRPVLLLPDSWRAWPASKLETVLIHEREHIRRRDPLVQWLALLNRCVFWFHPLAWWLERKLAALAEEACDSAVLARGHAAADYSRYLIEMARSINEKGSRIRCAGAVAFSEGKLPERIRRIMDAQPRVAMSVEMSRAKSIASAALCTLLLVTALACNIGRQSGERQSGPTSGQPTMAQQEQRDRDRLLEDRQQREQQGKNAMLWSAVLNVSPDGAKVLLDHVKSQPDDQANLQQLIRYYQSKKDLKSLDALTLWFIAQHPDMRANWSNRPQWDVVWDQDGYRQAKDLWIAQLKRTWDGPYIYMNAAEYLAGTDNEQAEQILLEGRRRFPLVGRNSGLHWEMIQARLYGWALAGSEGPMPPGWGWFGWKETGPPNQTLYAQKVRAMLLASNDVDLLNRVVERLQVSGPNLEFLQALNAHALSIRPDDRSAQIWHYDLIRLAAEQRAKTNPTGLSDADRLTLLVSQLDPNRPNAKDESKARELLALASRNTKDPNYGTAIFFANTALGEASLSHGDKSEAARLLLAASEAPPTAFLRSRQIDMSLARKLVDAGEREAVATFLDRCAKFNSVNHRLTEWAAEIRKGINPNLTPNSDVFRKLG